MKKVILAFLIGAFAHVAAVSQPVPIESRVEYQKGDKSAALIELPYSTDVVANAIKENMLKNGIKDENSKGFMVFRGARLSAMDSTANDLYFKVDRSSRKDKNNSKVWLVVGRPNENLALRTVDDANKLTEAKAFLSELIPSVEARNLDANIGSQEQTIKNEENKLRKLEDEQKNLEGKLRDIEDRIAKNKRDQEAQNAEVNKQRQLRDAMQARKAQ